LKLEIGNWKLEIGNLDTGYRMQDTGYKNQDAGFRMQNCICHHVVVFFNVGKRYNRGKLKFGI
jgi:hypothetical protein